MKPSEFTAEVQSILYTKQRPIIDKRKNGYRMKFPHVQRAHMGQIEEILNLSEHVTMVGYAFTDSDHRYNYDGVTVFTDCKPSEITIEK